MLIDFFQNQSISKQNSSKIFRKGVIFCKIKGYSLAQLLIVIGIIAVIALITFPSFTGYLNNLELKNSTHEVVSHLKLAQQLAVTEQVKHAVRFVPLGNTHQLIKLTDPEIILSAFQLADSVYFLSSGGLENNQAVFNAGGAVDFNGEIYLTHQISGMQTVISVKPSGYVSWQIYQNP